MCSLIEDDKIGRVKKKTRVAHQAPYYHQAIFKEIYCHILFTNLVLVCLVCFLCTPP